MGGAMVKKPKDFLSGLLFFSLGLLAIWLCQPLAKGTARSMGPGYFPTALATILAGVGVLLILRSLIGSREASGLVPGPQALRAVLAPLGACAAFALCVTPLGLIPAVVLAVFIGTLGFETYGWRAALITSAVLSVGSYVVFSTALGLRLQAFGPWITG